ncbi:MAG: rod shape-determining protein RodA [Fibrobacteraceae bacterium]|nr:rod shape-determining protein RodA [Fibrobacteraceae bacterium]
MRGSGRFLNNTTKIDWFFLALVLVLTLLGITLVYSATVNYEHNWASSRWFRQIIYFVMGAAIAAGISVLKIDYLKRFAFPFYFLNILALAFVALGGGDSAKGAGRWIDFGVMKIQPSEFAKIAFLLAMSSWLSSHRVSLVKPKSFLIPGLIFIFPFLLVLKQPDLSTALVFTAVTIVGFYWAGLSLLDLFLLLSPVFSVILSYPQIPNAQLFWGLLLCFVFAALLSRKLPKKLAIIILAVNIVCGYASGMAWNSLEDHQRERVMTFVDPMRDPKGAGYQVIQSEVAIGSGGLIGKGFGEGSQTNLSFLPEEHTDFIFSVLGEQFGFAGCVGVLFLYFLFLWRAISICRLHLDPFVNQVVAGACTIFLFHITVNISMTLGLMPVTGLPLPFLSYGGSFLLTCMMLVGLLVNMRYQGSQLESDYCA